MNYETIKRRGCEAIVYTEFEDALIKKDLTFNSKINFNFGQGWLGHVSNVLCWWVFQKRILIIGPTQLTHFIWTMIIQTGLMGEKHIHSLDDLILLLCNKLREKGMLVGRPDLTDERRLELEL